MTDADVAQPGPRLSPRAWLLSGGIVPLTGLATIVAVLLAVVIAPEGVRQFTIATLIVLGVVIGIILTMLRGAEPLHRRVAAAREAWARTRPDATLDEDGRADPQDVALALPRGWEVQTARGRVRFEASGVPVRAETWVLRSLAGSFRSARRREIVAMTVKTGSVRVRVPLGTAVDSQLVTPSWSGNEQNPEPLWLPAVRVRVAQHQDMLASLAIGDDRVVFFALDDPRPETMIARAELVRDVASMIR